MPKSEGDIRSLKTIRTFLKVGTCSETACFVINRAYDEPMGIEEHATAPLAGGIMQHGYQCGLIWGAAMAAGGQAYRLFGAGEKAEAAAVAAARKIAETFSTRYNTINCLEIVDTDWKKTSQVVKFFLKGGPIGCFRMAAKFAPIAYEAINKALAEEPSEIPDPPVSCASLMAKRMGASDLHTTMAAGLAGGIGLSGGACGALGAAIWLTGVKDAEADAKPDFKDSRVLGVIDKFMKVTDCEFECTAIVGREFESVEDHAAFIRNGGCQKIIDALSQY